MSEEQQNSDDRRITIGKIYVKDMSFESPQAPGVFRGREWQPQTNLNLRSSTSVFDGDQHEVVLTITVDAKEDEKTIFLVELQQAGIFEIVGYEKDEFDAVVGSLCPNILFPYAREAIAGLIQKGGFPEFLLQPINFDALYVQSRQQQGQAPAETAPTETH